MRSLASRRLLTPALVAVVGLGTLVACSDSSAAPDESSYTDGEGIKAEVHPQLAAPGEDVEAATDAEYVVDARIEDEGEGREVELQVREDDAWSVAETEETDEKGRVTFVVPATPDMRVVSGDGGDGTVGVRLSTDDALAATYTDDFDDDLKGWSTRNQGYEGVRTCSRADDKAARVRDGVLQLSVLNDPARGECPYKHKGYAYRLNGHLGTEAAHYFQYGYAAARVKFQPMRGQHASFWLQAVGQVHSGDPKRTGAEIDVIEYFGDDHPQGGLTSFVYWRPKGGAQTSGGFIEDPEAYGDDWSSKYHVFSVEWTPEEYVFRIDGRVTHKIRQGISGQPQFLVLSLLSSDYELQHLDTQDLPQRMDVDWVRVWERPAPAAG